MWIRQVSLVDSGSDTGLGDFCFADGCDFDYTSPKTHFYPDGKPDPIRNGTDKLLAQLAVAVKEMDIHNISGNPNTLWRKL